MADSTNPAAAPDQGAASPRRPETDAERRAVWDFLEHMLYQPDQLYDGVRLLRLRQSIDDFLAGWRS